MTFTTGTTAGNFEYKPRPNTQKINANDFMKYILWNNRSHTPNGKLLAIILTGMVDPQRHTGLICPPDARLQAMTGWGGDELGDAVQDLLASGQWAVDTDTQGLVRCYRPLFAAALSDSQTLRAAKRTVKGGKPAFLWLSRYSGLPAVIRLAFIHAVASAPARWNFLGGERNRFTHAVNGTKLMHCTLFDHPLMSAKSPSGWAELASLAAPPPGGESLTYRLSLDWLAAQCGSTPTALGFALMEHPQGFFYVTPDEHREAAIALTPTPRLHAELWAWDRIPGGPDRNHFEIQHGFMPSLDTQDAPTASGVAQSLTHRPPLGFNWLYELVTPSGDVVQVGQSTQPLATRLTQHLTAPTNPHAHRNMVDLLGAGVVPTIRCLGIAHNFEVAEREVEWIQRRVSEGHHLGNRITTTMANAHTIHPDTRFATWHPRAVQAFLRASWERWEAQGVVLTPEALEAEASLAW